MTYQRLLDTYAGPSQISSSTPKIKLPRVWPGLVVAIVGSVWVLLDLSNNVSMRNDPFPDASCLVACYWYFCIFRIHEVVNYFEPTYRIGPWKAISFSLLPNIAFYTLCSLTLGSPESNAATAVSDWHTENRPLILGGFDI